MSPAPARGAPSTPPGAPAAEAGRRRSGRLGLRLASLIAVALLPLGVVSLLQADAWLEAARASRAALLEGATLRAAATDVGLLREAQGAAAALALAVGPIAADEAACDAVLSRIAAQSPQYSVVGFVAADGRMDCAAGGISHDYGGTDLVRQIAADPRPAIHVVGDAPVTGASILLVVHPVFGPGPGAGGVYRGYVALALPHDAVVSIPPAAAPQALRPDLLTFNRAGDVLTGGARAADLLPVGIDLGGIVDRGPGPTFTARTAAGEERLYAVAPLLPGQLYALGSVPAHAAISLGGLLTVSAPWVVAAMMWAGSLVVAWWAAERLVTRYMRRLAQAIGDFASGHRAVAPLDMAGAPREIADVARAFRRMTDTILHDEAELEDTLHQKEVLLREVHHRVKNNLQLIASIMNMQMRRARSPETRALMQGLQERVMSLATVHKELYQTSGQADVRADELLGDITRQILAMAAGPGRAFRVATDFAPLHLVPEQAVPLALLHTEGLTNAIKHAAPGPEGAPWLQLAFRDVGGGEAELEIANSARPGGAGPETGSETGSETGPEPRPEAEGTGLGRQLIAAFAAQLGGRVTAEPEGDRHALRVRFALTPVRQPSPREATGQAA
jgi:two-component sensor histidine kinase